MTGTLKVIGIGPGDPDLLTVKALKILKDIKVICVPKGREEGSSLALSIVEKVVNLDDKEIIEAHFPMRKTKRQNTEHRTQNTGHRTQNTEYRTQNTEHRTQGTEHRAQSTDKDEDSPGSVLCVLCSDVELDKKWDGVVETILNKLNKGKDVAFITLGDPTIYSTFFYLYERLLELDPDLKIVFIPGVSSINASAAVAGISLSLADEKIAILPATYVEDIKETLEKFDTVVLMKVHRVFDKVVEALTEMNLVDNAIYITRASMDEERIFKNIRHVKEEELNYFSTVIVKK